VHRLSALLQLLDQDSLIRSTGQRIETIIAPILAPIDGTESAFAPA